MEEQNAAAAQKIVETATNVADKVANAGNATQQYFNFEVLGVYAWHLVVVITFVGMAYFLTTPLRRFLYEYLRNMSEETKFAEHLGKFLDALPTHAVNAETVTHLARLRWGAFTFGGIVITSYVIAIFVSGALDVLMMATHVMAALFVGKGLLRIVHYRHKRIVEGTHKQRRFNLFLVDILLRRSVYALVLAYIIGIFHVEDISVLTWTIPSDYLSWSAFAVFLTTVFSPAVMWRFFNRHIGYPGDYIVVGSHEGTLVAMTLSHTTLRTSEGAFLIVPNKEMIGVVENRSSRRTTRMILPIEVNAEKEYNLQELAEVIASQIELLDGAKLVRITPESIRTGARATLRLLYDVTSTKGEVVDTVAQQVTDAVREQLQEFGAYAPHVLPLD